MKQIEDLMQWNREVDAAMWEMDSLLETCKLAVVACRENGAKEPEWEGLFSAIKRLNRTITEQVEVIGMALAAIQREGGLK